VSGRVGCNWALEWITSGFGSRKGPRLFHHRQVRSRGGKLILPAMVRLTTLSPFQFLTFLNRSSQSVVSHVEKLLATNGTRTLICFPTTSPKGAHVMLYALFVSDSHYSEALDKLQLKRYCCRRMVLTHVDLIEKLLHYNRESLLYFSMSSAECFTSYISDGAGKGKSELLEPSVPNFPPLLSLCS
jgi:DNA-directed RNA polymerase subunit N (RpoN/RPB10)